MAESIQKVKVRTMKEAIANIKDNPKAHVSLRAMDLAIILECAERGLPPDPVEPAPTPAPAPAPEPPPAE